MMTYSAKTIRNIFDAIGKAAKCGNADDGDLASSAEHLDMDYKGRVSKVDRIKGIPS